VYITYRTFSLTVIAATLAVGWTVVRSTDEEIVVLQAFDGRGQDVFATLWVVDDDAGFSWIRANRPDRRWLSVVRKNPNVQVRRRGQTHTYVANVFDSPEARHYVDPRFRAKYGLADRWREWRDGRDTVPVRLQSR